MVSRFTWTNWSKGKVLRHDENIWQGQQDGYQPVVHKRMVLSLHEDRWLVIDHLHDKEPHQYTLHWLLNDFPYEQKENVLLLLLDSLRYKVQVGLLDGQAAFSIVRGDPNSTRGWRSLYYGAKEPAISVTLETDQQNALFWTYFGFEADEIAMTGKTLNIRSRDRYTNIDLSEINK
jgi:hypothetical protein